MGRRRRAISLTAALLAAATLTSVAAPSAHAVAFAPFQLTGTSETDPYGMVRSALLDDGTAIVAHQRGSGGGFDADVALRAPGSAFAPTRSLTGGSMDDYDLAAAGRVGVVAWAERKQVTAARVGPGGTLGAPAPVGRGEFVDVEVNGSGDALVWLDSLFGPDRLKVAVWPRGRRGFGPVQDLGGYAGARYSFLLPTRTGFVVAWLASGPCGGLADGCRRGVVRTAVVRRDGRFGPVRTVGPARWNAELRLVERGRDGALLVWSGRGPRAAARAAVLRPGATRFGPVRTLSKPGVTAFSVEAAANRRGDGVVAWVERGGGTAGPAGEDRLQPGRVRLAVVGRDGRFVPSRALSAPRIDARSPRVRMNAAGDALIAWSSGRRWWVRTRAAGAPFGRAHAMPAAPRPWLAGLALDRDGNAVAVYRRAGVESAVWAVETAPRPRSLDGAASAPPQLVADRHGQMVATWSRAASGADLDEVRVAVRPSRGDFELPATAGTFDGYELFPHLNARGDILIAASGSAGADYGIGALVGTIR